MSVASRISRPIRRVSLIMAALLVITACGGAEVTSGEDTAAPEESDEAEDAEEPEETEESDDADDSEAFYAGKTITMVVPFSAGGGTDSSARLMAEYLSDHLDGNPTVQVENVTGGGSILGANEFALQRPNDGTTLLMTQLSTKIPYLLGEEAVEYDLQAMNLLWGHPSGTTFSSANSTGISSAAELATTDEELVIGARGPTGVDLLGLMGLDMLGVFDQINVIMGYEGGGAQAQAFEGGEVNLNRRPSGSVVAQDAHMYTELGGDDFATLLYTHGLIQDREVTPDVVFADLPTIYDVYVEIHGEEPSGEQWDAFVTMNEILGNAGYALWTHGDAPQEAVDALREAVERIVTEAPDYEDRMYDLVGPYTSLYGETVLAHQDAILSIDPQHLEIARRFAIDKLGAEGLE